jgi:hypothetical protein
MLYTVVACSIAAYLFMIHGVCLENLDKHLERFFDRLQGRITRHIADQSPCLVDAAVRVMGMWSQVLRASCSDFRKKNEFIATCIFKFLVNLLVLPDLIFPYTYVLVLLYQY